MGWWIALGIIVLLAVLPLGVSVRYDEDGVLLRIIAGPIKITLLPRPKKNKKPKKEKKKKEKKPEDPKPTAAPAAENKPEPVKPAEVSKAPAAKTEAKASESAKPAPAPQKADVQPAQPAAEEKPKKKGGSVLDFLPLVKVALNFLGDFWGKLRVNVLELKIILGGDDPCDLATNYGRAWAALGNLLPRLERIMVIQKRDIDVQCDFTSSKTLILARLDLTITLGRLLAAVFVFIFHALVEFIKIMIKRKGGASHEPKSS